MSEAVRSALPLYGQAKLCDQTIHKDIKVKLRKPPPPRGPRDELHTPIEPNKNHTQTRTHPKIMNINNNILNIKKN